MATKARIEFIERDIRAIIDRDLSSEAQSKAFADFAREQLASAEAQNAAVLGRVPPHETFVDGRQSDNLDVVRPDGRIIFEFAMLDDVLTWIGQALVEGSPIRSGRFAASYLLLADGVIVPPGAPLPAAEEYVYVNSQPYARKIERGLSNQAPDGVMDVVATLAANRFGNVARIGFGYTVLQTGALDRWAGSATAARHARRHYRRKRPQDWLRKQPAIFIRSY